MTALFFATPLGLAALAAPAAVVALYLFRRRRQLQPVTGLFLWGRSRPVSTPGRKRERLILSRPFWLDVTAALFFALAAGGLAWQGGSAPPVVILDDSFAMRSRDNHLTAANDVRELLRKSGRGAVILAGEQPRLFHAMGPVTTVLLENLSTQYQPVSLHGDLAAAAGLAKELYGHDAPLHCYTNQPPETTPQADGLTLHRYAGRGGNAAFGHVWRYRPEPGGAELIAATWHNYAAGPQEVAFRIEVAGAVVHETRSVLQPGETGTAEVRLAPATGEVAVSLVAGEDVIADDSFALLPPGARDIGTYAVDSLPPAAARYIALALEAAGLRRSESADLVVTGGTGLSTGAVTVRIVPGNEPGLVSPPYAVDSADRLCRDLDLAGTLWAAASPSRPDGVADVFIAAGDLPLYWRGDDGDIHLNLAVQRATLVADSAWPIIWKNLAGLCRERVAEAPAATVPVYDQASDTTVLADRAGTLVPAPMGNDTGTVRLAPVCLAAALLLLLLNWRAGRHEAWA